MSNQDTVLSSKQPHNSSWSSILHVKLCELNDSLKQHQTTQCPEDQETLQRYNDIEMQKVT